jgi:small subunit ribosomal protein S27e
MVSKFVKIQCPECSNQQIIFGKATCKVKCKKCSKSLIRRGGGKAKIRAKVVEVLR